MGYVRDVARNEAPPPNCRTSEFPLNTSHAPWSLTYLSVTDLKNKKPSAHYILLLLQVQSLPSGMRKPP